MPDGSVYVRFDLGQSVVGQLGSDSKRIAELIARLPSHAREPMLSCLSDLLGAAYSLFKSVHLGYSPRPDSQDHERAKSDLQRARQMAEGDVRLEGKWAAGYYLNSALFRIDSLQFRALEMIVGIKAGNEKLLDCGSKWFRQTKAVEWNHSHLEKVNDEVRKLKHEAPGIAEGRGAEPTHAIGAIDELLVLLEAYQKSGLRPVCTSASLGTKKKCGCR